MNGETAAPFTFCEPATICLADTSLLQSPQQESAKVSASQEDKKHTKKRKSWGQELPVPKTNLPPRKRAKTDDEKEQRRIERVLRNRQAAQSSRERKRLEVEKLENERDVINQQNHLLRQRLLQVEQEKFKMKQELAEMRALLKKHAGELTPSATPSPLMNSENFNEQSLKEEDLPSLFPSITNTTIVEFPQTTSAPAEPLGASAATSDLAQHPAAVLCDLPCQSEPASLSSRAQMPPAVALSDQQQALAMLLLFQRIHLNVYSTALIPLSQLLASLKKGSRLKIRTITPTLFTSILWLISTPRSRLRASPTCSTSAPLKRTTIPTSSTSSPPSTTQTSTFRTSLLRRLLACSPALARPLRDATARALREKASYALRKSSDSLCSTTKDAGVDDARRLTAGQTVPKGDTWLLMTMALVIDQFLKERRRTRASR